MRTSIWYRTELKNPDKSGHYLAYRGWGMGGKADGDHDHGYMYYDKKTNRWYEYSDKRDTAIVYYWTDATPDEWTDQDPPSVQLRNVKEAPNRFDIFKGKTVGRGQSTGGNPMQKAKEAKQELYNANSKNKVLSA